MPNQSSRAASVGFGIVLSLLTVGCASPGQGADATGPDPATAAATALATDTTRSTAALATAAGTALDPTPAQDAAATPSASLGPVDSPQINWTLDLYKWSGLRRQYPDQSACTAADVLTSLNLIALDGAGTPWSPTVSYEAMEMVLDYERAHMSLPVSVRGSDPHGTRNALNYFGWGSQDAGVHADVALPSFSDAAKAVVASIARTRKPAIIFSWFGTHAQVVTGYRVRGSDPTKSDDFSIVGVYVTDPLEGYETIIYGGSAHTVYTSGDDTWVTLADWQNGSDSVRFTQYWQSDSTLRDPVDGRVGRAEWYNRWVVVLATR